MIENILFLKNEAASSFKLASRIKISRKFLKTRFLFLFINGKEIDRETAYSSLAGFMLAIEKA